MSSFVFTDSILEGTNFEDVNLQDAQFGDCYLKNASFKGADISNALFFHADVSYANFAGVKGLPAAGNNFYGANVKGTILDGHMDEVGNYVE